MNRTLDVATSFAATLASLAGGLTVGPLGPRPEKPLELYEFERCPFCRKVREALTILDLDAIIYPCPSGGPRFRKVVEQRGGKAQFPYLVDPNTGREMYESDAIIHYLSEQYGTGKVPTLLALGPLTMARAASSSLWRLHRGRVYRTARAPEKPLELYSFEASPFCRIVREELCELEIPYLLHNVGKKSPKREAFVARGGKMQVPWLHDPNTDRSLYESADIVAYLNATYAA
ncbi:glutathione S-transferase N-terminal domain-containing protein [Chondromyces crocatus]|uniref:Glutathione S-transferase n=1 Tax=Chondromyces crocatus TaxID=52 RepID=A0A0K1E7J5_CHOCO|nr:glutathione S-transferase N-terminal domain-containing protein [Chondromyces crocatus]AKT36835.1 glutathione S-transferase [Chondromyces crocatus]